LTTTNTATTNDDGGQNNQKTNYISKPRVRKSSFVNCDGIFLPVIRDDSHLFRSLKDDRGKKLSIG